MDTKIERVQTPSRIQEMVRYRLGEKNVKAADGGLLCDGQYAWTVSEDGVLSVVEAENGEVVAVNDLVPVGRRTSISVCASCELRSSSMNVFVLGLSLEGKCVVTIFSSPLGGLIKAVQIPWEITSLCGLSAGQLQDVGGLFSPSLLKQYSGVLAVGCVGGHLLLVDLGLGVSSAGYGSVTDPLQLVFIDLQRSGTVSNVRDGGQQLACYDVLADRHHSNGQFQYSNSHSFPADTLAVTALYFVPQISCVFIGYSIGAFQIYSVEKMDTVYKGPLPKLPIPVTHFTYLEPENDPKHHLYLWVARGNPRKTKLNVDTCLSLYQLVFESKEFKRCCSCFTYHLTTTPTKPHPSRSLHSSLLLCHTPTLNREGREADDSTGQTVAVFVWSSGDHGNRDCFVGIFDLNQYYLKQLPRYLNWQSSGKQNGVLGCSYFAFYSLKDIICNREILDVVVMDVIPFFSLPPIPETHLWSSSLSFNVRAIANEGFQDCSCLGLQRKALEELDHGGVALFSSPQTIFNRCERAELLGPSWDHDRSDINILKKALLSVALDHHKISVIRDCAITWTSGGGDVGLQLLMEWLRDKMTELEEQRDHLYQSVFRRSQCTAVWNDLRMKFQLLAIVTSQLLSPQQFPDQSMSSSFSSTFPSDDLNQLFTICSFAVTSNSVLQTIIWFQTCNIPLSSVDGCLRALEEHYTTVRKEMDSRLCVDCLCEDLSVEDYHYPPHNFRNQMNVCSSTNATAHHSLMIYFIIDLCTLASTLDLNELLKSYKQTFLLPSELVQFIRGLWALDHSHYDSAIDFLEENSHEWFPWQQKIITDHLNKCPDPDILSFLLVSDNLPISDMELVLKVLVERRQLLDAIKTIRTCDDDSVDNTYAYFLDLCYKNKCLKEVIYLPLTESEDSVFCLYLKQCPSFMAQELLVYHYMEHSRHGDAIAMQTKIRPIAMMEPAPGARRRSQYRDQILSSYLERSCDALRELWTSDTQSSSPSSSSPATPTPYRTYVDNHPLSSVLAKNEATGVESSVALIFQHMQKIRDITDDELPSPFSMKDSICQSTPFLTFPSITNSLRKWNKTQMSGSVVQATPLPRQPVRPPPTPSTATGLQSHMNKFRQRLSHLNTTALVDPSYISTPAKQPSNLPGHTVSSILRDVRKEEKGEHMEERIERTEDKKIRFAEERTVVEPTSSTKPLRPAAEAMAAATPLPLSDDVSGELFCSFSDTPPNDPQKPSPNETCSPVPPTALFIGADDDECDNEQTSDATETLVSKSSLLPRHGLRFHSSPGMDTGHKATPPLPVSVRPSYTPRLASPLIHSMWEPKLTSPTVVPLAMGAGGDITSSSRGARPTTQMATSASVEECNKYSFSPGKILSTPPVSSPVMKLKTPAEKLGFAFSPPFTRSAAKRAAAQAKVPINNTGLEPAVVTEGKSIKRSTNRRTVTNSEDLEVLSPPSQPATPATRGKGKSKPRKTMTTRSNRSARLMQDKRHNL